MNIEEYLQTPARPLDRILPDGGFAGIFRTIGCIGDSLSSGEMQLRREDGAFSYHDLYDYSWGQYIARALGCKVYNFSRGGMTAKWYMDTYAVEKDFFNPESVCQAYIVALGVNDITAAIRDKKELGTIADAAEESAADNFVSDYAAILRKYKQISPRAKFFLVTIPRAEIGSVCTEERARLCDLHQKLMYEMAALFPDTYVIDLRAEAPAYDKTFRDTYFLNGHMNPAGYLLTAKMMMSYIDWIIRKNPKDFSEAALIGTSLRNCP